MIPEVPLDEDVSLEEYTPAKMHCDDLMDRSDGEDDCLHLPGKQEPPLDDQ